MTEGDRGFAVGERVMLLDSKRRRYLVELVADGEFHSHAGYVAHSSIIGSAEGTVVESTKGAEYVVLRPTLEDFVLEMPRGAQVIYPKDLAPILMLADIAPGVRVFESGLGSGALSTAMLRAGAEVTGYEVREDFANRARINVRSFLGEGALERRVALFQPACVANRPEANRFHSATSANPFCFTSRASCSSDTCDSISSPRRCAISSSAPSASMGVVTRRHSSR